MIDLHSHLLPGVDDGARDLAQSLTTLSYLTDEGYHGIVLTPHFRVSETAGGVPRAFDEAYDELTSRAPNRPTLYRGVELMVDTPVPRFADPRRLTLAGSRYLLVEFPLTVIRDAIDATIGQVTEQGLIPLIAHPERYVVCSVPAGRQWREQGALVQVDATTITRPSSRGQRARALFEAGLVDVLAGDNHGDKRSLRVAYRFLEQQGAGDAAELLTVSNPRALVENREPMPMQPKPLRQSWSARVRGWLGAES